MVSLLDTLDCMPARIDSRSRSRSAMRTLAKDTGAVLVPFSPPPDSKHPVSFKPGSPVTNVDDSQVALKLNVKV